ncbi:Glyoxalase/bleomycin resistance protein/dioxygenase [Candidatus Filomicrobium marinum]|uniref:Glyoxalase/bleomycin resistance protein/dioxygenase n=1 Tax=Candidatus Filomicrobium marinum TaxID=1608628 RepID=A0A0D6JLP5_9HYPH|nr:VOC family protein [Candidatus Filomicrobium marinum]CFX64829.1 Glyoxalase/bleomycin resistance protein/dioxygenase [Candidatus Filomicrobium marinum]CPR22612.1 Glyoxalase/bleomycin resistance protein/dioxygenase [Candidatus Filomicrobium marinum]
MSTSLATQATNRIPYAAPLRIGTVTLRVRDLQSISRYYEHLVGLRILSSDDHTAHLGTRDSTLLKLIGDPGAEPRPPGGAGLFHTAFLLPNHGQLALWTKHAVDNRFLITGASDHAVSEAIYLSDPEGNGIEIYADRPREEWRYAESQVKMVTEPLDVERLLASASGTWSGLPDDGVIGHVHLQIGALDTAESFYGTILGFDISCRYSGANFFGSGGYHHQLATNAWASRGAGPRPDGAAGLVAFEILADKSLIAPIRQRAQSAGALTAESNSGLTLRDPWNIEVTLRTNEATKPKRTSLPPG